MSLWTRNIFTVKDSAQSPLNLCQLNFTALLFYFSSILWYYVAHVCLVGPCFRGSVCIYGKCTMGNNMKIRTKTNSVSPFICRVRKSNWQIRIERNFGNFIFRKSFGDVPEMGQHCAPERICGKINLDGNCVSTHGADCTTGELPAQSVKRFLTHFPKRTSITSASAAASPPWRPGPAERCSAVLQPDSQRPPETRTAGYTSAPAPTPLSAAEKPDLPLHGGDTEPPRSRHTI